MSSKRMLTRRGLLKVAGISAAASTVAACGATPTPQVVEREVTRIVEGTPQVVKETVVVEKVVEATAAPAEKVTVRFSSVGWGGWLSEPWQSIVQDFNASQDRITVPEYEDVAEGYQKVMAAAAGNVAADVYMFENKYMFGFAARGFFLPLDEMVAASSGVQEDMYIAADWGECFFRGKQYLVPFDNSPAMIWYNPDLFDAAGVAYPPTRYDEWNWEDFLATAQALTSGEGAERQFGWLGERGYYLLNWIWGAGGWFLTEDKTRCVVDSPEAIAGLQWAADLVLKYQVQPLPENIPQGGNSGMFYAKRGAMAQKGTWWAIDLKAQEGLNWQTAPQPTGAGGSWVRNPNDAWGIWIGSPNRSAAWEFIEFLNSDESLTKLTKAGLSTSKRNVLYDVFVKQEPTHVNWQLFIDALEGHVRRHPDTAIFAPMMDIFNPVWDAIIAGDTTPAESMPGVAAEINALLDQCRAEGNCD
ncbi:MAG: extracellular solute-binding protein [Anaerolineae bacterium]|nr:extracellular solute-binding protein [Anaerolineae bacterium]